LAPGVHLGPPVDLSPVLFRDAQELAEHLRREQRREVVHELDLAAFGADVQDAPTDLADAILEPGHGTGLEVRGGVAAQLGVTGRVHHQEHVLGLLQLLRRQVLEHDPADLSRVQTRFPGDFDHVRRA